MIDSSRAIRSLLALAVWMAMSPAALAEECDGVGEEGACADAQTLQWCADGEFMEAICPKGEICAQHDAFDGGYGCLPLEDSSCGDVTLFGDCTSGGNLVWCSGNGELMLEECPEGTTCSWDDANMGFECLPSDSMMAGNASSMPDGDGQGDFPGHGERADQPRGSETDDDPGDGTEALSSGNRPTPEVRAGEHQGDIGDASPTAGCGASSVADREPPLLYTLAALLFLLLGVRKVQQAQPVALKRSRKRLPEG